jgi:hypothetical protein
VGDLAFFEPYGFKRVLKGQMILPGPADPNRLLWRPSPGLDVAIPAGKLLIQAAL